MLLHGLVSLVTVMNRWFLLLALDLLSGINWQGWNSSLSSLNTQTYQIAYEVPNGELKGRSERS